MVKCQRACKVGGLMDLGGFSPEKSATKFRTQENQIQHLVVMVEDTKGIQVMHGKNF